MSTDYNSIIPNKILFNLKETEEIGLIKTYVSIFILSMDR